MTRARRKNKGRRRVVSMGRGKERKVAEYKMVSYPAGGLLFVVVMAFDVNDEHGDCLVVDVVDDAVVG